MSGVDPFAFDVTKAYRKPRTRKARPHVAETLPSGKRIRPYVHAKGPVKLRKQGGLRATRIHVNIGNDARKEEAARWLMT